MTQPNPIGVHFLPTHQGPQHFNFIRDMQPSIVKIVGSGQVGTPDVQIMADCYAAAPDAIHLYRNQPMSEEHDFLWRDPVGAAQAHVATMNNELGLRVQQAKERKLKLPEREQWRITGICEPIIELFPRNEDMSNYDEWLAMMNKRTPKLDDYMSTFMVEADKVALQSGIANFSGGQPANLKPGEYATYDWFPKTRKVIEAANGRHFLSVDEYWDIQGPEEMIDWWTCRWKHCNWDCKIGVVEAGIDRQIRTNEYEGNRGWIGHMEAPAYVDQHERYIRLCQQDPRFLWETPYTLDGDKIWWSFFIEACMPQMVALSAKLRAEPPKPPPVPIETHLPSIGTGSKPTTLYVNAPSGANIRATPAGEKVGAVAYAEAVETFGLEVSGGVPWMRVIYNGISGWIAGSLLAVEPPAKPEPAPMGDNFERSLAFIKKWEGGWADDPNDVGGATNKGITLATFTRWREVHGQPTPTKDDLRALTDAEANQIFHDWYWLDSHSDQLPWPLCLVHFNFAVNAGPARAQEMLQRSAGSFLAYMALVLEWYTKIDGWQHFGAAWTRRCADVLREAAK